MLDGDCGGGSKDGEDIDNKVNVCTHLHTTNNVISDLILEDLFPHPTLTSPAPNILPITILPTQMQDQQARQPHDDIRREERNRKYSIIYNCLFRTSVVPAPPIPVDDDYGYEEGDAGDGEEGDLRPDSGVRGPG